MFANSKDFRKLINIAIIAIFISSCSTREKYFSESLRIYNIYDTDLKKSISGEAVINEIIGAYRINIIDSIICVSTVQTDLMFNIYNLDGDSIMSLGQYGQGPSDFTTNIFSCQNFINGQDDFGTWIIDVNSAKLKRLNLGKSIKKGSAEVDSVIPMQVMVTEAFIVGDTLVQLPNGNGCLDITLSALDGTLLQTEPLYKVAVNNNDIFMTYHSPARISPDGRYLVTAMASINQINILDLRNNGDRKSISLGGVEPVDKILNDDGIPNWWYYSDVSLNDKYIMAVYTNCPYSYNIDVDVNNVEIHIVDYRGNLICRLPVKQSLYSVSYSERNNSLYAIDLNDTVWKYDLSELNL